MSLSRAQLVWRRAAEARGPGTWSLRLLPGRSQSAATSYGRPISQNGGGRWRQVPFVVPLLYSSCCKMWKEGRLAEGGYRQWVGEGNMGTALAWRTRRAKRRRLRNAARWSSQGRGGWGRPAAQGSAGPESGLPSPCHNKSSLQQPLRAVKVTPRVRRRQRGLSGLMRCSPAARLPWRNLGRGWGLSLKCFLSLGFSPRESERNSTSLPPSLSSAPFSLTTLLSPLLLE